mgnify:CR=1 FL=1
MNKAAIKNFAVWARNKLIADISYRAGLMGITAEGIREALPQSTGTTEFYDIGTAEPYSVSGAEVRQRRQLAELIRRKERETNYKTAYKYVLEEVAYTWFNRLIAVRFMEVNDYLPSHIRVLSSDSGKTEPDLVTNPFGAGLSFTQAEQQEMIRLKQENKTDEAFRLLFIKQCNALNEILPALFEKTSDYTELLLNLSVVDQDGVLWHLVHDIPEADFDVEKTGQVEIIGWLYQFYNTDLKNKADEEVKAGNKITGENLPEKTQVFTPDWIVRYMVENSLGRLWVEGHPNEELKARWKYYLEEAEQDWKVKEKLAEICKVYADLNPEDIKIIDPCMGSGHILVYAFDVLMQIYESAGYNQRDAAKIILEHNIYGLDIDNRAYQLAYFAIMMKARQYNRRILNGENTCHVYAIQESNSITRVHLEYFGAGMNDTEKNSAKMQLEGLLDTLTDAKEYGSILNINNYNWDLLRQFVAANDNAGQISIDNMGVEDTLEKLNRIIDIGETMARKYWVTVTNPPYLGLRSIGTKTITYIQDNFPDSKNDFFAVFIEKAIKYSLTKGKTALVTAESWLSLSSFEKLRSNILNQTTIESMAHFGEGAFDSGFGTVAFVLHHEKIDNYMGSYFKLKDLENANQKQNAILENNKKYLYVANQEEFSFIPGYAVSYWVSQKLFDTFTRYSALGNIAEPRQGLTTCDNDRFMRCWSEISIKSLKFGCQSIEESEAISEKWFPYNKGGEPRRWYGNNDFVVNWQHNGAEIKEFVASKYVSYTRTVKNIPYYFRKGLTWSAIAKKYAVRAYDAGFIFADKGQAIFTPEGQYYYLCGLMNSKYTDKILEIISPTLDFNCGYIKKIPIAIKTDCVRVVDGNVKANIAMSKEDWDSFETSWDFKKHPLLRSVSTISEAFAKWKAECDDRFNQLKSNEEELNRIFIEIYDLQDELNPEVEDKEVTVRRADLQRDIKSLLSYAVGCMFGRYSLDVEGLAYAGGEWDSSKYQSFKPDADNVIPLTDEEYLEDDIISRLSEFLKVAYGEETLEENLDFIAKALGNKGDSSREIIRNYFLSDFFKDHCQTYSVAGSGKRPIYWLFDAGKNHGFKVLIYLHRYNADTIGTLRIDYLHRMQRIYESEMSRMQDMLDHSTNAREIAQGTKRREKLVKQLKECREYDEKLAHLALSRIQLDLDDGVKKNYRKIQIANDGKFYEVLADSKNIMSKE